VTFSRQSSHAAESGRGDGLAPDRVQDVAGSEHACRGDRAIVRAPVFMEVRNERSEIWHWPWFCSVHNRGLGISRIWMWLPHCNDPYGSAWPERSPEERAWIWLHYGATKLQRGELFEAMGMVAFFREQVLGPMINRRLGRPQRGVRKIEQMGGEADKLCAVVADHGKEGVTSALWLPPGRSRGSCIQCRRGAVLTSLSLLY
jgi:hypothetical protein